MGDATEVTEETPPTFSWSLTSLLRATHRPLCAPETSITHENQHLTRPLPPYSSPHVPSTRESHQKPGVTSGFSQVLTKSSSSTLNSSCLCHLSRPSPLPRLGLVIYSQLRQWPLTCLPDSGLAPSGPSSLCSWVVLQKSKHVSSLLKWSPDSLNCDMPRPPLQLYLDGP